MWLPASYEFPTSKKDKGVFLLLLLTWKRLYCSYGKTDSLPHGEDITSGYQLLWFSRSVMLTLFDPMDCSTPGFPVLHQLPTLLKLMSIKSVMPSNHLILCHPLLLLPSIFPSITVFSNESALPIRWAKYWSFSFSLRPFDECSRLISFKIDWLDLFAVQGTLKSLL